MVVCPPRLVRFIPDWENPNAIGVRDDRDAPDRLPVVALSITLNREKCNTSTDQSQSKIVVRRGGSVEPGVGALTVGKNVACFLKFRQRPTGRKGGGFGPRRGRFRLISAVNGALRAVPCAPRRVICSAGLHFQLRAR